MRCRTSDARPSGRAAQGRVAPLLALAMVACPQTAADGGDAATSCSLTCQNSARVDCPQFSFTACLSACENAYSTYAGCTGELDAFHDCAARLPSSELVCAGTQVEVKGSGRCESARVELIGCLAAPPPVDASSG